MTDTAPDALTELDPQANGYAPTLFRSGRRPRRELWSARSADGVWAYQRVEDAGTTWTVTHLPTGRQLPFHPSLAAARWATGSGTALAQLDRLDADKAKPRCTWTAQFVVASCGAAAVPGSDRCPTHGRCTVPDPHGPCLSVAVPGTDRCRHHPTWCYPDPAAPEQQPERRHA